MKRIYRQATVAPATNGASGHMVCLDGRPVRTPAKHELALPSRDLAEDVAAEWQAQADEVIPDTMPLTRLACTSIDLAIAARRQAAIGEIVRFGETDLLCYRAGGPPVLVSRQHAAWQPVLDWVADRHGLLFATTTGVLPIAQSTDTLTRLRRLIEQYDDYVLVGLHSATVTAGSVVLGLALAEGYLSGDAVWDLSLLDETFQAEQWGVDSEAAERQAALRVVLRAADRFLACLRG